MKAVKSIGCDKAKMYLGRMCPRGHEWKHTGKTLRYISNKSCAECKREDGRKFRKLHKKYSSQYMHKRRGTGTEYIKDDESQIDELTGHYKGFIPGYEDFIDRIIDSDYN